MTEFQFTQPSVSPVLDVNRGSDVDFKIFWVDTDGDPANLIGCTVQVLDASPIIAPHLTVSILDVVNGVVAGRIEWHNDIVVGTYKFRVQVTVGVEDDATPLIEVTYR